MDNPKTVADVRKMLNAAPTQPDETVALPPDAVSATIETVEEQPMQTRETVQVVKPAGESAEAGKPKSKAQG